MAPIVMLNARWPHIFHLLKSQCLQSAIQWYNKMSSAYNLIETSCQPSEGGTTVILRRSYSDRGIHAVKPEGVARPTLPIVVGLVTCQAKATVFWGLTGGAASSFIGMKGGEETLCRCLHVGSASLLSSSPLQASVWKVCW